MAASLAGLLGGAVPLQAQVAVPYYGPDAFVGALQVRVEAPYASQFAQEAAHLAESVVALCDAATTPGEVLLGAQGAWLAAANAWEQLQAVSVGATLERRSARTIDFRPARPRLIRSAINAHGKGRSPPGAKALERVGTPAKGLPALEWLLWDPAVSANAAACRYATGLAQDVEREADALAEAHGADAARWLGRDAGEEIGAEEAARIEARATEAVNQWLAGLEVLRWRQLGKPLAMLTGQAGSKAGAKAGVKGSSEAAAPDPHDDAWPRPPSASHRDAWRARWESLRQVAIGPAPTDGFGPQPVVAPTVVSLEAMLRGRGRNEDADRWARIVMAADQAMQDLTDTPVAAGPAGAAAPGGATPLPPVATMEAALRALDAVKRFMQATVAPALSVTLGFSDADGD